MLFRFNVVYIHNICASLTVRIQRIRDIRRSLQLRRSLVLVAISTKTTQRAKEIAPKTLATTQHSTTIHTSIIYRHDRRVIINAIGVARAHHHSTSPHAHHTLNPITFHSCANRLKVTNATPLACCTRSPKTRRCNTFSTAHDLCAIPSYHISERVTRCRRRRRVHHLLIGPPPALVVQTHHQYTIVQQE